MLEAISPTAPPLPTRAIMAQRWRWVSFLHWRVESASIAHLFPDGTRPDEFDGSSWVGLIGFHLSDFSLLGGPPVPYFGSFPEINVRLYSVDARGRRGVVFLSLEAARLVTVLGANVSLNVPYKWARMSMRVDRTIDYRSQRLTDSRPSSHIVTRPRPETVENDVLADFLTARWGMHSRVLGSTRFVPNEHEPWPLRRADVVELDDQLLDAAGLPGIATRRPESVLYSPGVTARFGLPVPR